MVKSLRKIFSIDKPKIVQSSLLRGLSRSGIILILVGTLVWSLTMIKSGLVYDFGVGFWGANGHDGVWHLSLANSLANGTFEMPIFAGEQIKNYHVGFDLILASIHSITQIPISLLYFQILPPLIAVSIGILAYKLIFNYTRSPWASFFAVFLLYFGNSWGWVFGKGESMFWAMQSPSTLINPPYSLSLVFLLLGLLLLQNKKSVLAGIAFGFLIFIKAYAGVLAFGALALVILWQFILKVESKFAKTFIISFLLSLLLFIPFNKGSGELLVFQPFWFLETMIAANDRVGWHKMAEAMLSYKQSGVILRFILTYGLAFLIFFFGNIGLRVFSFIHFGSIAKRVKELEWLEVFFFGVIVLGTALPMLFVQSGTAWNTIQFFYYSLFFLSLSAGIGLGAIWQSKKVSKFVKFGVVTAIFLVGIIPLFQTVKSYTDARPPAKISREELEALEFLKNQEKGIVLVRPFDKDEALAAVTNPPRPLYLYESTSYVSAYSEQKVWMEDELNLDITGYEWEERKQSLLNALEGDQDRLKGFLLQNNIKYIYWPGKDKDRFESLPRVFANGVVTVYKVY